MDRECDDRSGDDAVGYRRPPKRTQWQKGQCGNPTRKRKSVPRGSAAIIDQLFAKRFKVTENGSPRTASGLEVIITRLISKEISGDRRAMTVRLKYLAFALRQRGRLRPSYSGDQDDDTRNVSRTRRGEGETR